MVKLILVKCEDGGGKDFILSVDVENSFFKNKTVSELFKSVIIRETILEGGDEGEGEEIAEEFENYWEPAGVDPEIWWSSPSENLITSDEVEINLKLSETGYFITNAIKNSINGILEMEV